MTYQTLRDDWARAKKVDNKVEGLREFIRRYPGTQLAGEAALTLARHFRFILKDI